MLGPFLAIAAAAAWPAAAQNGNTQNIVHGTVIISRSGERTPYLPVTENLVLTAQGAQQAFDAGAFFRQRYFASNSSSSNNGNGNAANYAPIQNISQNSIDYDQVYVAAPNTQYILGSAQAFMQGLYPPHTFQRDDAPEWDVFANNSFAQAPLGGYQYPQVMAASDLDPNIIYLAGQRNCINLELAQNDYFLTDDFSVTQQASAPLYQMIGSALLSDVLRFRDWNYTNAYYIWDYLSFQNAHNSTVRDVFNSMDRSRGSLDTLRTLADQQMWALYTNNSDATSIKAVAGQTLAARIIGLLYNNVVSQGARNKVSLIFTEFEPLISFFAASRLWERDPSFIGVPDYASSLVFELFSTAPRNANASTVAYPTDPTNLWVRFSFRNSTAASNTSVSSSMQAYPLFGRGPSQLEMQWSDFVTQMRGISGNTSSIPTWCQVCQSPSLFCAAFNDSSLPGDPSYWDSPYRNAANSNSNSRVTAPVAGAIGALVTLAVLGLAAAAAMLLFGVRFHRRPAKGVKSPLSAAGGFKGSAKLASDADLHIPKHAAPFAGATVEKNDNNRDSAGSTVVAGSTPPPHHERVGSWEMKDSPVSPTTTTAGNPHFDANPFASPHSHDAGDITQARDFDTAAADAHHAREDEEIANPAAKPVRPRESV